MFGQRNNNSETTGAPAVPSVGTLNTSNGIPDDQAVTQMLADPLAPSLTNTAPQEPANSFMPFSGQTLTSPTESTMPSVPPIAPSPPAINTQAPSAAPVTARRDCV